MKLPSLVSSNDNLNSYCNFIEYTCFVDDYVEHSEFDIADNGLKLDDILLELKKRLKLYGDFQPYRLDKAKVTSLLAKKDQNLHYFYCLYYAIVGGNSKSSNTNIFEYITDVSLKNYFSTSTSNVTSIGVSSTRLKDSISKLRASLQEVKGNYSTIQAAVKDGGIDIITYKTIDDRGNQLVCLTDATIGRHWKREKKVAVKLARWKDWILFKVEPITCLSVVHVIDESEFHNASRDNGLLFDRPRIMKNFKSTSKIQSQLKTWVNSL